jgi:hypothetical protein
MPIDELVHDMDVELAFVMLNGICIELAVLFKSP